MSKPVLPPSLEIEVGDLRNRLAALERQVPSTSRRDRRVRAEGFLTETFPRAQAAGASVLTSQRVYFALIGFRVGDEVSSLHVAVTTAGSGTTVARVGVYSTAGVLLAESDDLGVTFHSAGVADCPLAEPWTCPASGGYYAAVLVVASSPPTLLRGYTGTAAAFDAIDGGVLAAGSQSGQSSLPDPASIAVTDGIGLWAAASTVYSTALVQYEEARLPTAAANTNDGATAWASPANALTENAVYASLTPVGGASDALDLTGLGFSLPDGSTITGIKLRAKGYRGGDNTRFLFVRPLKNYAAPTSAQTWAWSSLPTSNGWFAEKGGSSELWGTSWSADDIAAAGFGVRLQAGSGTDGGTVYIDTAEVTVYYIAP